MFWTFLIALIVAIGLIKLGALSVWVSVLTAALKLAFLVGLGVAAWAVWKKLRRS